MDNKIWDVVVIGGGPAGMMAAGRAAERGKRVLLLEKNDSLGKKLRITGGGRCNVTNNKPEISVLISSYKNSPKPLYSLFSQFGVSDTLDFFHSRNMQTKLEPEDRVFPLSNKAESVWQVMVDFIKNQNVTIKTFAEVKSISVEDSSQFIKIHLVNSVITAKSCVVATGGTSHPETGSTGDGFIWLKQLGHTINANNFALVPVALKDKWIASVAGLTLDEVKISIYQYNKKQDSKKGRILFTHVGLSGPTILNMSSKIGELLQEDDVFIDLDLFPELDLAQMKRELHETLSADTNKKIKNVLHLLIPKRLVPIFLDFAKVDPETFNHSVTKAQRSELIKLFKGLRLTVKGLLGADKAIVSSGGVKIEEVNFKTMMSRIIPNLFIVGDVLDIDRPSGGYSLQICWASGYVAGDNC